MARKNIGRYTHVLYRIYGCRTTIISIIILTLFAARPVYTEEYPDINQTDSSGEFAIDSFNGGGHEVDSINSDSKFQVFMSIEAMSEQSNIIGNFLNLQRYSARQSFAVAHRDLKKKMAAMQAKRCGLISIFREPLDIAPFEVPWPVQCDVRLDNDFHTITPLISF
jgi:hypothetical protein